MTGSVATQIENVEAQILRCSEVIDDCEKSMRLRNLSSVERDAIKTEKVQSEIKLQEYRAQLKSLRKENFKNAMLSVVIMVFIGIVYVLFFS